ncbi:MAG: hypothetical protein JNM43_27335 [Planctomycetaceae bacterium]|nr:hypothetical protein [Planctomycetaceae bacterium]
MVFSLNAHQSMLRCPRCRSTLVQDGDSLVCTNPDVRLRYPVLEGIPRLIVDEATELTSEEWNAVMAKLGMSTNRS